MSVHVGIYSFISDKTKRKRVLTEKLCSFKIKYAELQFLVKSKFKGHNLFIGSVLMYKINIP